MNKRIDENSKYDRLINCTVLGRIFCEKYVEKVKNEIGMTIL